MKYQDLKPLNIVLNSEVCDAILVKAGFACKGSHPVPIKDGENLSPIPLLTLHFYYSGEMSHHTQENCWPFSLYPTKMPPEVSHPSNNTADQIFSCLIMVDPPPKTDTTSAKSNFGDTTEQRTPSRNYKRVPIVVSPPSVVHPGYWLKKSVLS